MYSWLEAPIEVREFDRLSWNQYMTFGIFKTIDWQVLPQYESEFESV